MRFFALREPPHRQGAEIDACHRWFVPGIVCDICRRTWTTTGIAYPTLAIPEDLDAVLPRRPVPRREFTRLVPALRERLGSGVPLPPGTELGPLVGTVTGSPARVHWQNPWTLLLSSAALAELTDAGIPLRTVPAVLKGTPDDQPLHEIEIRPHGYLRTPGYWRPQGLPCASCGYERLERPERVVLNAATLSGALDIFRIADFPTIVVVTERFLHAMAWDMRVLEEVMLA
jgi:uncharacterized double-CXXCG motif protein